MRKPLLPVLLLCMLLISCRAQPERQPPRAPSPAPSPAPSAPPPPVSTLLNPEPAAQTPSAVFQTFLEVARAGDHAQAWNLLSKGARAELGPSSQEFASRAFAAIKVHYGLLEEPRIAVDQVVSHRLAIVAVTGRRTAQEVDAVAAALVHEEGGWKLALHGAVPVEPVTLGPAGIVLRAPQVTVERLWLDDQPVKPVRQGETYTVTIPPDLDPRPTVVALLVRTATGEPLGLAYPIKQ